MASGIGIGELVWVTQGKTDHMAMYIGDIRKPDSDDDDDSDSDSDEEEDEEYVSIKWTTTNMIEYVPYSSVRLAMNGQRRRRIVPNHYMAVPAPPARAPQPPPPPTTNNNNNSNSKSNTTEASAAAAATATSAGGKKVFLTDKSSSSIDKQTVSDKNGNNGTLKKSAATAIPDMGKCRFCNEMFSKYGIKRHETTCMRRVQAAAAAAAATATTTNKNKNTNTNKLKVKGKKRSNTFASSTTSASSDDDDDELDNNDNDEDNPFEGYNDPTIKIGRHYLWEWENSSDSHTYRQKLASQKHASAAAATTTSTTNTKTDKKKLVPRNYLVYNKNNHKSTNNVLASIHTDVRTPRSWEEGYGMMIQFYNNCGHCNISTNHPILGKFIRDIRSEHKKYCKFRSKKKKNPKQYKNQVYRLCTAINRNCRRLESGYNDMTRVDWRKVSKLNSLGFIFRPTTTTKTKVDSENNENENENKDSYEVENEDDSIHSELLDDDDDEEEEEEDNHDMLKLDSDESVDYKSGDDSDSDSEDTDDDDDDDDDDGSNNSINKNNNNQGGLSAYEKLRLNKIKRNEDKLKELGLYKFAADTKNDAKGKKKKNNKAQQVLLTKKKELGNDDNGNEESKMGENENDLKYKSKMGEKKEHDLKYRKGSRFFNNKMIRRDLNLILQPPPITTNNDDDDNDNEFVYDEYLTVSSLDEIDLTDSCNSNKKRNDNGELTFPIQLCRLLNSSKQLGIDKIVSWSSDGNSFHVYSESDFVTQILKKTTLMTKMVSILNAFGQFNIISPILGKNCRTFQHRSIEEAKSSDDPTKRLFYRGVSVDVLRKIKSRREERGVDNGSIGSGGGGGGGIDSGRSQFNRQPIKKRKYADHHLVASPVVWKDDECDSTSLKDGSPANAGDRKRSSSGRRILTIDRLSLGDGSSIDRGGDDKKNNIKNNKNIMASNSYQYHPEQGNGMSRSTERRLRQTSDGCLHPKGGKEQYLMNNGTYDIPAGKRPANLSWDPIRGLWVPPDRLNNKNGDDDSGDDGDGDGGTPSSRGSKDRGIDRAKRRTKDGCLLPKDGKERYLKVDGTYRRPDGARPFGLSWHKIRGLWVPSESLRNGIGGDGDDYDDDDTHYKVFNRETERALRLTSDGCLIPKGGKEKYLRADGYYKMPDGARPSGLSWNKIRGLWAPPERLNEGAGSDGDDEDEDETFSGRTTDGSLRSASLKKRKRSDDFVGGDQDDVDGYSAGHDIDEINYDPDQTGHFRSRNFKNRFVERQARRTRDGCLLPKRQPRKKDDGTYEKPKGHEPKNLHWDTIRGLWAPDDCLRKKTDGSSSLSVSSSSSDDEQIIRASDANLFHHSSPMWRDFFQFKKHNRERRFQARTKGNPTGIIGDPEGIIGGPQLNKSNWGKIEKLMQRHHHTINTNTSTIYSDDGDTHFV